MALSVFALCLFVSLVVADSDISLSSSTLDDSDSAMPVRRFPTGASRPSRIGTDLRNRWNLARNSPLGRRIGTGLRNGWNRARNSRAGKWVQGKWTRARNSPLGRRIGTGLRNGWNRARNSRAGKWVQAKWTSIWPPLPRVGRGRPTEGGRTGTGGRKSQPGLIVNGKGTGSSRGPTGTGNGPTGGRTGGRTGLIVPGPNRPAGSDNFPGGKGTGSSRPGKGTGSSRPGTGSSRPGKGTGSSRPGKGAGGAPSGGAPSGGAPSGGAPSGGAPSGAPSGGAPSGGAPSGGAPSGGAPSSVGSNTAPQAAAGTGGIPPAAVTLIKHFEGFFGNAYPDPLRGWSTPTIGWGTTFYCNKQKVKRGDTITRAAAETALACELNRVCTPGLQRIPTWGSMNSNQRAALYSFAYNLGAAFYGGSGFNQMTRLLSNRANWTPSEVRRVFLLYRNPGSNVEAGLRRRRTAEANLFLAGGGAPAPASRPSSTRPAAPAPGSVRPVSTAPAANGRCSTVAACAAIILASPRVQYWSGLSTGSDRPQVQRLAAGQCARVPATGGCVFPKLNLMQMLAYMATNTRIHLNALTGGHHSRGSNHYRGAAVDLDLNTGNASQLQRIAVQFGCKRNFETSHIHIDC